MLARGNFLDDAREFTNVEKTTPIPCTTKAKVDSETRHNTNNEILTEINRTVPIPSDTLVRDTKRETKETIITWRGSLAQWTERDDDVPEVVGSIPTRGSLSFYVC